MNSNKSSEAIEILEKHKDLVWPIVESYLKTPNLPKLFDIPRKYLTHDKYHWKIASDYPKRKGKYLRPTILILMAQAMGAKLSHTLNTAAAMQMSEEWILVHDDIEDGSVLRRGLPTLHLNYGKELAINAGDALHVLNWNILIENTKTLNLELALNIMKEFSLILSRTTVGQTADISMITKNVYDYTDEDWYFIADGKTSYYTVGGPLRLGAIIAGANEKQLDIISEFGLNLGRSFQIVDDLLDITSDFSGLKSLGNDIYEGKRTLILGHLIRNADKKDRDKIVNILQKSREEKSEENITWITKMMHKYQSIEYAQAKAQKYKSEAQNILLNKMDFLKDPYKTQLTTLMNFVLERKH